MNTNKCKDFKVIGYFPNWHGDVVEQMDWEELTHVNYAFAIPTAEGTIRAFNDDALVHKLIETAHGHHVKAGLSVGGWSYEEETLEGTFVQATQTDAKCRLLADSIMNVVEAYGFDGVDMDWEYPREGTSSKQYESLMALLRTELTKRGKFLTAAVVGNGEAALGQTGEVLSILDWVNVMAYDGEGNEGHSPYSYAVGCGEYWINTRGVSPDKVVMGLPFYGRPDWLSYRDIVEGDPAAAGKDSIEAKGTKIYYNGMATIADKTAWACRNACGVMIWEITQDSREEKYSLLKQIGRTVRQHASD